MKTHHIDIKEVTGIKELCQWGFEQGVTAGDTVNVIFPHEANGILYFNALFYCIYQSVSDLKRARTGKGLPKPNNINADDAESVLSNLTQLTEVRFIRN